MLIQPPPNELLGKVVEFWAFKGKTIGFNIGLPKPYVELVISLSGYHAWKENKDATVYSYYEGWVTPIQAAPRFAKTTGELNLIGARLSPAAAQVLFKCFHQSDISAPIPLNDLLGSEFQYIRDRMLSCKTEHEAISYLSSWLKKKLIDTVPLILPERDYMSATAWRVDSLAAFYGLSSRGLRKRFQSKLGIGPKLWLQLHRFDSLLSENQNNRRLVDTAFEYGFTDQAHMSSEFRRFSGTSPRTYFQQSLSSFVADKAPHFVENQS